MSIKDKKLGILLLIVQIVFLVLFTVFGTYSYADDDAETSLGNFHKLYPMFQDVHAMIFVGFGFLMTFLKKYGYSSVSFNLLLSCIAIQWSLIMSAILDYFIALVDQEAKAEELKIPMNMEALVNGDFAAAVVLISFGALLGKTSPFQLTFMVLLEIPFYLANFKILERFGVADAGGSLGIHMFGAYFGLATSLAIRRNWAGDDRDSNNGSSYQSDMFSMIGTVFLWIFWPSFNGVLLTTANQQERTAVNTYLSMIGSTVTAIALSQFVSKESKLDMVHVQNATLAGGVAVGTAANFIIQPYGALLIGSLAGMISTLGYSYIGPFLEDKLGLHDTCGVHNLHGMPAILAGVAGIIGAAMVTTETYGQTELSGVFVKNGGAVWTGNSTVGYLAAMQGCGLAVTLLVSIIAGLLTGLIFRFAKFCDPVDEKDIFRDDINWCVPEQGYRQQNIDETTGNHPDPKMSQRVRPKIINGCHDEMHHPSSSPTNDSRI